MKKKVRKVRSDKKVREPKQRFISIGTKIIMLLEGRSDVTRLMLPELVGAKLDTVDVTLTKLRKAGFRIFSPKGPDTPLKIAKTQLDSMKYINHRRRLFLPTAKRMILTEVELSEQFVGLADKPVELLESLNDVANEGIL